MTFLNGFLGISAFFYVRWLWRLRKTMWTCNGRYCRHYFKFMAKICHCWKSQTDQIDRRPWGDL